MLFPSLPSNLHRVQWQSPLLLVFFPSPSRLCRLFSLLNRRPSLSPSASSSSSSSSLSLNSHAARIGPLGLRCLSTGRRKRNKKPKSETAQKETYKDLHPANELRVPSPASLLDDYFRSDRLRILVEAHQRLNKSQQRPALQSRHRKPKTFREPTEQELELEEKREQARRKRLLNLIGNKLASLNISVIPVKMPAPKRKAETETKYYAVRAGVKPGVYTNWTLCQQQITGFKGAVFKSFTNYEDASAFAAGRPLASDKSNTTPTKFYGVAVGRTPGVYTDWSIAQQEVVGWKNPKYKKFETRAEAEEFVRQWSGKPAAQAVKVPQVDETDDLEVIAIEPSPKNSSRKARKTGATQTAREAQEVQYASKPVIIYTDGSARGNGKVGAVAGVGVYFCGGFRENISERLQGPVQTNQRAELTAVLRALESIPDTQNCELRTDSQYTINCVTSWYKNWMKNGWRNSKGEDVSNQDLIVAIRKKIDTRDGRDAETKFVWVKGHGTDEGNIAADLLAVEGAKKFF